MNARVYFLLLRPWWSLSWVALSCFALSLVHKSDPALARWVAFGVFAPYLLGACIASAAHAAMHRPFFPLLPEASRKLCRPTLIAVTAAVVGTVLLVAWLTRIPAASQIGLSTLLLALPLANPRRGWIQFLPMWAVLVILGTSRQFEEWMMAARWAFLVGGLGAGGVFFRAAFNKSQVRRRADVPFNSVAPTYFALANESATRRYIAESSRVRAASGMDSNVQAGRPWRTERLVENTWCWMRVYWHAARHRMTYPWSQSWLGVIFATEIVAMPLLGFLGGKHHGRPFAMADYWSVLAALGASDPFDAAPSGFVQFVAMPLAAGGLLTVMMMLRAVSPAAVFPITRKRRAQVAFGLAGAQTVMLILWLGALLTGISLLGQLMSGRAIAGLGVSGFGLAFAVAPLLPVVAIARAVSNTILRVTIAGVAGAAAVVLGLTRPDWGNLLLTPIGLLIQCGLIAAAFGALYAALRRHYRRCDLVQELRMANPMAAV